MGGPGSLPIGFRKLFRAYGYAKGGIVIKDLFVVICAMVLGIVHKVISYFQKEQRTIVEVRERLRNRFVVGWRQEVMFVYDEHNVLFAKYNVVYNGSVWTIVDMLNDRNMSYNEWMEQYIRYMTEILITETDGKITIG